MSWTTIDADAGIWKQEYSFGPGLSTCFVTRAKDGLVAISPACGIDPGELDSLEGDVVALVAPNGFHHLGLPLWKKRFPKARIFASGPAAKRIAKKQKDIGAIEGLDALTPLLPENVHIFGGAHMKHPDVFARVQAGPRNVWYSNDIISNMTKAPPNPVIRFLFWASGTKTGFSVNKFVAKFLVGDKAAFKQWLVEEMREHGPDVIVPGHGPMVEGDDLRQRAVAMLEAEL